MSKLNLSRFVRPIAIASIFIIGIGTFVITRHPFSGKTSPKNNIVHISGILAHKDWDALIHESTLVVEGTVTGQSDAFQIESPSGAVANHIDYTFAVISTLRGNAEQGNITVRTQGGTVGDYTEVYEQEPTFEDGKSYLLFLYQPGRGGAFNTSGNYYYVLGLVQGVYEKQSDGSYVSQSGHAVVVEELYASLSAIAQIPVDTYFFRNEYLTNQARNLENGFITQEEYENAIANIDVYATIIE
jgi:hypothetical protein